MFDLVESARVGAPVLGVIVPAAVFLLSFLVTYLLMRHFLKGS